jgi:class 3 adenylate cyclase
MAGAGIELPPTDPPSDEERRRVLDLLRGAGSRLGLEEAERRMDAAVTVPTKGELALLVWDLPDAATVTPPAIPAPRVGAFRSAAFRAHATAYGLVNGMLVGIWAITDSNHLFWPFFPIAGWGVGLGMNAVGTRAAQRHSYEKEVRRLEKAARGELAQNARASVAPAARPDRHGGTRPAKVVVMFTDVVDSTRLTMVIGDEDWTRLRKRYRDLLHDCYRARRGREVSSHGDGFLARFDRPSDAVECAADFLRKLRDQREQVGFAPAVRIGINAGDAIEEHGDVLGTTVNLAARVTQAAEPNEILITEVVADALDGSFHLTDQGLRDLKGLDRTAHVLSVTWQ